MAPRIFSSDDELHSPITSSTRQRETTTTRMKGRRVAMATHDELTNDPIAWPTLIVFAISLVIYLLPLYLFWDRPTYWTVPITVVSSYAMFTAMHEACHRAISAEHRWLNEGVGYVAVAICFQAPFRAFRYIHLSHHKYTNDPQKDPDNWSAGGLGPWWIQPLFWSTQQLYYYYHYFSRIATRPKGEAIEAITVSAAFLYLIHSALNNGYGQQVLVFFALPRLITDTCLAYSFDYAPHHPHNVSRDSDIYACTSMIGGLLDPNDGVDLSIPLIYQNYHNIHHLYPTIPFYKYKVLWENHEKELLELGTPVGAWFGFSRAEPVYQYVHGHMKAHAHGHTHTHTQGQGHVHEHAQ